jgi:hypothetical protein
MQNKQISERMSQDIVREQAILWHIARIKDRNPSILTAIEERWDELNAAFSLIRGLHREAHRFAELYQPLCELSSEQDELAGVDSIEEAHSNLDRLAEVTEQIDDLIARLFKLFGEIEADCFRWLNQKGI